jgi:hypothetical protein
MYLRRLMKTIEPMDVLHFSKQIGSAVCWRRRWMLNENVVSVAFNVWCCSTTHIKFDIAAVIKFSVTGL